MEDWDDWDLQAVVRGCGAGATAATRDPFSSLLPPLSDCGVSLEGVGGSYEDLLAGFADLPQAGPACHTAYEELEQLCRPFFHTSPAPQQNQRQHLESTVPVPVAPRLYPDGGCITRGRPLFQPASIQPPQRSSGVLTPRSKRRKNQQKKVVCQVPADALSSDVWAWRKYGQKPIKGSPYPRGYYRCSSSKGCLARKQVERSRSDPSIFIITYTAEHNHPVPTHRNSLAGSTRHKFHPATPHPPSSSQTTHVSPENKNNAAIDDPGANSASPLPPRSPFTLRADDALLGLVPHTKKEGDELEEEEEEEDDDEGMLLLGDMDLIGEDDVFFLGLDELSQPSPSAIGRLVKECSAPGDSSSAP